MGQNYFTRILEDNLKAIIKPQYVDHIPRAVNGCVGEVLMARDQRGKNESLLELLGTSSPLQSIGVSPRCMDGATLTPRGVLPLPNHSHGVCVCVFVRIDRAM
jgi:hypothetical protein